MQHTHTGGQGKRDQCSHSKTWLTGKGSLTAQTAKQWKYRLLLHTPTRKFEWYGKTWYHPKHKNEIIKIELKYISQINDC